MDKPVMNVAVASSREYSRYLLVMLTSIYENHPDVLVHCYVMHEELTEEDIKPLEEYVHSRGHEITFIKIEEEYFHAFPPAHFWPRIIFCRVLTHLFLPDHLDRVLILGIDSIVNKNIWEFYRSDFEGNHLTAIGNPDLPITERRRLVKSRVKLFCADFMLWNLEMFRENVPANYYSEALTSGNDWLAFDETLLNYMFWDKVKLINSKQLLFSTLTAEPDALSVFHYGDVLKPWYVLMTDDEFEFAKKYPVIFSKGFPPAFAGHNNHLLKLWWKYAEFTPFYDEMFREMKYSKRFMLRSLPYLYGVQRDLLYGNLYRIIASLADFPKLLAEYFAKTNVKSVAIYGYSEAAELLEKYLSEIDGDMLRYIIDQYPVNHPTVRWVASKSESFEPVDLVIVTALQAYENIKAAKAEKIGCSMVSFLEISQEIYDEAKYI